MIWLALAKRYAAPIGILVAFGLAYSYHLCAMNGAKRAGYRAAQAEMAAEVAIANQATAKINAENQRKADLAAQQWESQRNALESQVSSLLSKPHPAIRLCKPAASGGQVPGTATAATSPNGQPAGGLDAVRLGDDIGRAAVVLAGECERYRQQLSALQEWIRETR